MPRAERTLDPIHPGEVLREEFMVPKEISINRLARDLHVPPNRVSEIVNGRRAISADTALRLARYFKTTAELWLNLQMEYDVRRARRELDAEITAKVRPYRAA
jgi:addiction module HigA family antidote